MTLNVIINNANLPYRWPLCIKFIFRNIYWSFSDKITFNFSFHFMSMYKCCVEPYNIIKIFIALIAFCELYILLLHNMFYKETILWFLAATWKIKDKCYNINTINVIAMVMVLIHCFCSVLFAYKLLQYIHHWTNTNFHAFNLFQLL